MGRTFLASPTGRLFSAIRRVTGNELLPYAICCCAAILFLALAARDAWRQRRIEKEAALGLTIHGLNSFTLLAGRTSFLGSVKAPYTLVEFGDYECPYCKIIQGQVSAALNKHKDKVKLDFRQFPLRAIHPYAEEAALAAEAGRPAGKFWTIHEYLLANDISKKHAVDRAMALAGVAPNRVIARHQILLDAAVARQFSVNATPSFFLCRPDGGVVRLPSLQAIDLNVKYH